MSTKEEYNERRRREDHCSSCGKFIGLIKPRYCNKCKLKHDNRVYVRKVRKVTRTLKVYTKPIESWRLYLYEQYMLFGIRGLLD